MDIKFLLSTFLSLVVLIGCQDNTNYKISLAEGEVLTEETAIRVTREALIRAGYDIKIMEPVSFRNELFNGGENFFARNKINEDQGYVLWQKQGEKGLFQYSVSLKKHDTYVICNIGHTK